LFIFSTEDRLSFNTLHARRCSPSGQDYNCFKLALFISSFFFKKKSSSVFYFSDIVYREIVMARKIYDPNDDNSVDPQLQDQSRELYENFLREEIQIRGLPVPSEIPS